MNQNEFNQFYDSLRGYANKRAIRLFFDIALKEEAIDVAMDRMVDWLLTDKSIDKKEAYCKTIIKNSLLNSLTRSKIIPVNLQGTPFSIWGFSGRKFKD